MYIGSGPGKISAKWKKAMDQEKNTQERQPSDHKAYKVTLLLDIFKNGKEGNRAIINYNNKEGWILYKSCSNFYAKENMDTVPRYKNKYERQQAFMQIMHRLDIECFGIKYKKSKSSARRMGKYKHKEVKELSEYAKAHTHTKIQPSRRSGSRKVSSYANKKSRGSTNGTKE